LREEIRALAQLGPFPSELEATENDVRDRQALVQLVNPPGSDEEARALLSLFANNDDFFGLVEMLSDVVESAPGWPLWDAMQQASPLWRATFGERAINSGHKPPDDRVQRWIDEWSEIDRRS
jgi:hypothetical protein